MVLRYGRDVGRGGTSVHREYEAYLGRPRKGSGLGRLPARHRRGVPGAGHADKEHLDSLRGVEEAIGYRLLAIGNPAISSSRPSRKPNPLTVTPPASTIT